MEASKVLSRLLPVAEGDEQVSVYEGFRRDTSRRYDVESQRANTLPFRDDDDDPEALLYDAANPLKSVKLSPEDLGRARTEDDEDVPESLLLDGQAKPASVQRTPPQTRASKPRSGAASQWRTTTQEQQDLDSRPNSSRARPRSRAQAGPSAFPLQQDPRADAMWLYTSTDSLDAFLLEVYRYFVEHGVWSMLLQRALTLLTELFVFSFAMFLTTCIDYSKIPTSKSTAEVLIPRCMAKASWTKSLALFVFIIYWLQRLARDIGQIRRLFRMHDFFLYGLGISDQDIQTVSWVRVVDGLVKMQDAHVSTANQKPAVKKFLADFAHYEKPQQRLNAESIANRLMRRVNYDVAMYNKDILDFTLPLPFLGHRHFYSKSLEWCIDMCLTNFIFDEQGNIRPFCLDVKNRDVLENALRTRLRVAAVTSVLIAPFNILRFCIVYFFRYYTEFTRNPSSVSARTFTPFAEWKMRDFNELEHLFQWRLRQAYPYAHDYLKQFPKDKMDQACRFIAFISGALAAVLAIATLLDPELFLGFEITEGRNTVFWLTVTVGIFGVAHGALPDDNDVHDPVLHLKDVLYFTHYIPSHWHNRLHSSEVRNEFSAMYQMKILIFVEEILSLIMAPWILYRNSTSRCARIVDFFRENTVHVDGIGHQCNFAVFGFKKDPNAADLNTVLNQPDGLRDDYYGLKDDKMEASVQNFMQYYSHYHHRQGHRRPHGWQPPPAWPQMLSSAIAEEQEPAKLRSTPAANLAASRRSGFLDPRQGRATSQQRTARPPTSLRDRRGAAQELASSRLAADNMPGVEITESVMMRQDADLHEYALDPAKERLESDTEEEEGGTETVPGGNTGVLGMLYQFSKAQADAKGPNVAI